ncbi:MAG: hypothetical protein EPN39_11140 [Chitinophagaceae bacterium]|nr:MAG: hypothetical protein EPN39_11140 [Chitinophagaceae bacterium]
MLKLVKIICLLFVIASCTVKPSPILYGKDACNYCRMTIMDPKFDGEIVTRKGKVYKFDAEECLASFYKTHLSDTGSFAFVLVANYAREGKMLSALDAFYLNDEDLRSPMGVNVAAFPDRETAEKATAPGKGKLMDWNDLLKIVP